VEGADLGNFKEELRKYPVNSKKGGGKLFLKLN
jgi:hypothetical protein